MSLGKIIGLVIILGLIAGGGYSYYHNSQVQEESVGQLQDASLSQEQAEEFHEQYGGGFVLPWEDADDYSSLELEFAKYWAENPGLWNYLLGEELAESNINEALEGDYSGDGIKNRTAQEMGLILAKAYPAVSAALEGGIGRDEASIFEGIDPDYVDQILGLPKDAQEKLVENYIEEGEISLRDSNQIKFLSQLQDDGDLEGYLQNFDPANTNVSSDGFTNYFSLTQSDVIDWDVQNRRFVIYTLPSAADDYPVSIDDSLVEEMGIPENQVHRLLGESATWENFQEITDNLEDEVTEDDILVVSLAGEGGTGSHAFYGPDSESRWDSISYNTVDEELDEIPGKQAAVLNACFSGSAIPRMEEDRRTILASSGPEETTWGIFFLEDFYEEASEPRDGTYPSLREVFDEISEPREISGEMQTPQISNPELAGELYLGQPEVED